MLEIGNKAPDFKLQNQDEKMITLEGYDGKWLVLYFYPKDNTPGCTLEAKDFTCMIDEFKKLDTEVVGVSKDSVKSHNKFISKHELGIDLLVDEDHKIMEKYGVWQQKKLYGRTFLGVIRSTFIINPKGEIAFCWYKVRTKGHVEEVLKKLKELI